MSTFLLILVGISAVFLIIAVLIQPGKGDLSASIGGLGSQFGSMLGMRKAADFLQKLTVGLAIAIFVLSLFINRFLLSPADEARRPVTEGQETTAPASMPAQQPIQQQPEAQPAQQPAAQPAQQ